MVKAALLDRDSTLIKDNGYTFRPIDLIWVKDAIEGLSLLDSMGYKLIVITNQSGIARGYYTEREMKAFHQFMNGDLKKKAGITIEKFYHCPHHPDGKIKQYRLNCNCRKPGGELFKKAILDFGCNNSITSISIESIMGSKKVITLFENLLSKSVSRFKHNSLTDLTS